MTALLRLPSLCIVLLLTICTSSYLKPFFPGFFNAKRPGFPGVFGKFSVIGDRLSPYVSISCLIFAFWTLISSGIYSTMGSNFNPVDILPCQTLYLSNLDDQVHVDVLKKLVYELFIPYGMIVDIVARKTKSLRGQAFVVFSATAAIKGLNGRKINNKPLKIEYAKKRSYKTLKPAEYYKMSKVNRAKATSATEAPEEPRPEGSEESHTLFVENIPHEMSKDSLDLLFKQYPGYKGCRFIEGRFVAFVDYAMAAQAEIAMEGLQGFRVSHTHALKLSLAK